MLDHNHTLTTPPRWGGFWGSAVLMFFYAALYAGIKVKAVSTAITPFDLILILLAYDAFVRGIHYTITKEGIIVKWLNIPLRKIVWGKVNHAEYIHLWKEARPFYTTLDRGLVSGQIIYVTLNGCPTYYPTETVRLYHNLKHPLSALCIWLPRDTKYGYIDLFKEFYPNLEIQPLDEWKKM